MIQKSLVVDDSSPVIPVYSSIQSSKVPADLEKILNYIDVEFSKRKCQADVYDESRYRIFDEALTRVIRTFKVLRLLFPLTSQVPDRAGRRC